MSSPTAQFLREIVGADAVLAGKASHAAGVVARGHRLTVRLTRPVPDFPARTTMLCAVPPTLPNDPEGLETIPAAGPYYVADYRPRVRVILRRNRFYGGRVRTTSTASRSISPLRRAKRRSTASSGGRPTGAAAHLRPSSSTLPVGSSRSTA
jgi:hypothetical protein